MNERLLYIITLSELGGAQSNLLDIVKAFRNRYDVHLATSTEGPLTETARSLGLTIHLLPSMKRSLDPVSDFRAVWECVELIRQLKPSLIHAHSSKAGLISRLVGAITRTPTVFTAHGWGFKPGVPLGRRGFVWLAELLTTPLINKIICPSYYDKHLGETYLIGNKNRQVTIHHGLEIEAKLASPSQHPVNILMTARFQEPKEQQVLLRAFARVQTNEAKLIFAGDGPELLRSQALAHELNISDQVEFLGERTDVPDLLAQAQIFVLLSRYECLPISILEAMRAGLPVIASDVGGISEEIDHNVTGILTPRSDVQAVTEALMALIADSDLRERMGHAGRQKFLEEFTLEHMITRTQELYHELLGTFSKAKS